MEKQKQTALPKETPEQRPLLICTRVRCKGVIRVSNGVWLVRSTGGVIVKASSADPFPEHPAKFNPHIVGQTDPSTNPEGPKYTGPIDDEMMANILIYG